MIKIKNYLLLTLLITFAAAGFSYAAGGFLSASEIPDSVAIIPPPPDAGGPGFARDAAVYKDTRALRGSERWKQAAFDADVSEAHLISYFTAQTGVQISKEKTPDAYALIKKIFNDFASAPDAAKKRYMRTRPFVYFKDLGPTCAPQDEENLSKNGSYPSGHTSIGYGQALVLAQILPEKQNEILMRGYEYGQSRVICGAHWKSDVDSGYLVAAAVFARLQNNKDYLKAVENARKEFEKVLKEKK